MFLLLSCGLTRLQRGCFIDGADDRDRTDGLRFTRPLLYQLSYTSMGEGTSNKRFPHGIGQADR